MDLFYTMDNLYLGVLVACALAILSVLKALVSRRGSDDLPYVAAGALLTPAERHFFKSLQQALAPRYHIFAKVRLADIIQTERGLSGKRRYAAFNRISAKHADFIVCDPRSFRIIGVVELDDSSHQTSKGRKRDSFVDSALAVASIPILRVPVQRAYGVESLRDQANAIFCPLIRIDSDRDIDVELH